MPSDVFEIRSITLQMMLDGINWTDVTADVLSDPGIDVDYGLPGAKPTDRVAKIGNMKFRMDNSQGNSAGLLGYYTPGGASCRTGFELNVMVRVTLEGGVLYGAAKYGSFKYGGLRVRLIGHMKSAVPKPGVKGPRYTDCSVADFMYEMERYKMTQMPITTNTASGAAVQAVLDNMTVAPEATELATGQEVFSLFGDGIQDERTTAISVIQKICMSEFGFCYLRGDGTFVFEDRHHRVNTTPLFVLEADITDMEPQRDIENIINLARMTVYPREVGTSNEILSTLQRTQEITAGATVTFTMRYADPSSRNARISGKDMVTPVVNTDYKFGSTEGGGANDMNANLTVVVTFGGNSAEIVLTNTAGVTGYVNLFQLRGKAIRTYETVTSEVSDAASQALYDERITDFSLSYQGSPLVGADFAYIVVSANAWPQFIIPKIGTVGRSEDRARMMLRLEPGDRITVGESVLDIDAVDYFIHGVNLRLTPPNIVRASWSIKIASTEQSWLLGLAGFSELGVTTFLGA